MTKQLYISTGLPPAFELIKRLFFCVNIDNHSIIYVDTPVTSGYTCMYPLCNMILNNLYMWIHRIHFPLEIIILLLLLYTICLYTIYYFLRKKCFRVSACIVECISVTCTDTRHCIRLYPCIPLLLICFSYELTRNPV